MNKSDEIVYLGRLISLLARHEQLSLGEIKNKTKAFLRKRHQTDSSVFNTLELFVSQGILKRKVFKSRIYYALGSIAQAQPGPVRQVDLIEAGVDTENELFKQIANQALKHTGITKTLDEIKADKQKAHEYVPKAPPPNSTEGFK